MTQRECTGGRYVYQRLKRAGVDLLVGLPGTQTLPLDRIVAESDEIQYVMARHETAIPHIAWGHYEAGGDLAATLTVPGPGDTNVMHGLKNALEDCVPILHLSADVNPEDRGKGPIHEIEPETYDNVVKENINVRRAAELPGAVSRAIGVAQSPPTGPVRLGIPNGILDEVAEFAPVEYEPEQARHVTSENVGRAVDELAAATRPLLYVGGGARRSDGGATVVAELAQELDAPVLASYKGKGVFSEDSSRFLGVSGSHLPTASRTVLEEADVVLALGNDFDGVATDHWELPFGERIIHVNLRGEDIDRGYTADIPIVGDVATVGEHLLSGLRGRDRTKGWDGARVAMSARDVYRSYLDDEGLTADRSPLRTPAVLEVIREETPAEAVVTADVGGFRLWAMQAFPAYGPERYIAAGSWAGMGVGLPAAIGAKLADPNASVLCLTGDGGVMMCLQELQTAVEEGLGITVVISKNDDYGIISKSPKISDVSAGHEFAWSEPDFAGIADSFGCRSASVDSTSGLRDALQKSFQTDTPVPTVISVDVATEESSAAAVGAASPDMDVTALSEVPPSSE